MPGPFPTPALIRGGRSLSRPTAAAQRRRHGGGCQQVGKERAVVLTDAAHPAHQAGAEPPLLPGEMPPLHLPSPGWGALGHPAKRRLPPGSRGGVFWWPQPLGRPWVRVGDFSSRSSSHRTTSYTRCPRRGHRSFLLRGMAAKPAAMPTTASPALSPAPRAAPAPPGAEGTTGGGSSVPAKSSPSRRPDGRQSRSESSRRGRAELLPPASGREAVAERGAAPRQRGRGCGRRLAPRSRALPRWQALGLFSLVLFSS